MPVASTSVPMQLIAPIPVTTPNPTEAASAKNELLTINGVNEKTLLQLEKLGIYNIDDLAKASAEDLTRIEDCPICCPEMNYKSERTLVRPNLMNFGKC